MIKYINLYEDEICGELFEDFICHQNVKKCWRKGIGKLLFNAAKE